MPGTIALRPYTDDYWRIPADVRWHHIRDGLARALELAAYTIREAAARRGSRYLVIGEARDLDAGHCALFGRPEMPC